MIKLMILKHNFKNRICEHCKKPLLKGVKVWRYFNGGYGTTHRYRCDVCENKLRY